MRLFLETLLLFGLCVCVFVRVCVYLRLYVYVRFKIGRYIPYEVPTFAQFTGNETLKEDLDHVFGKPVGYVRVEDMRAFCKYDIVCTRLLCA